MSKALKRKNRRTIPIAFTLFTFILAQTNSPLYGSPLALPHESVVTESDSEALGWLGNALSTGEGQGEFALIDGGVVYIDRESLAFAIFREGSALNVPALIGRVISDHRGDTLVPSLEIEQYKDLYVIKNPYDPSFLQVVEKLEAGGFGRILRYRGVTADGKKRDLEFIYQDKENRITILDHLLGKFYRTNFREKRFDPLSVFPKKDDQPILGELLATVGGSAGKFLHSNAFLALYHPSIQLLFTQSEALHKEEIWARRHVRGPPIEEALS